jgi:hypothetical protein
MRQAVRLPFYARVWGALEMFMAFVPEATQVRIRLKKIE